MDAKLLKEIPNSSSILNLLIASWKSYHGYPASTKTVASLHKLILIGMLSGESCETIARRGAESVMKGRDAPDEQYGGSDTGYGGDVIRMIAPAPIGLRPRSSACRDNDPEPPSPVDDMTRRFLQALTGLSSDGKSLLQDFEEALISPTSPGFPPEAFGAELEGWAPDTSAELQIDGPLPPTATDGYSESDSSPTWPSFSDDEVAMDDLSENFSTMEVSANQEDEISGEEQIEEQVKEPLQSTD